MGATLNVVTPRSPVPGPDSQQAQPRLPGLPLSRARDQQVSRGSLRAPGGAQQMGCRRISDRHVAMLSAVSQGLTRLEKYWRLNEHRPKDPRGSGPWQAHPPRHGGTRALLELGVGGEAPPDDVGCVILGSQPWAAFEDEIDEEKLDAGIEP